MRHEDSLTPAQVRQKLQKGLAGYSAGNDTGPIVFRLKRTKKASETYPLKLTQQQRETLLECTQLSGNLKKKIGVSGEGTQIVSVTWNELHKLNDETGQAAVHARSPHKKRLMSVISRVVKFFEEEHAEVFNLDASTTRRPAKTDLLFQFKITLLDIKPAIWRRVQVPDCTLADLHKYIQAAFGWENCHLHQFEIEKKRYSTPTPCDDDLHFEDESTVRLSGILPLKTSKKVRWLYEYDFGDGWRHEVLFEGNPPIDSTATRPVCIEGERACPPEDCGGPWGYSDFLNAITNRKHPRHRELREWTGDFDPETFDPKAATKEMGRVT